MKYLLSIILLFFLNSSLLFGKVIKKYFVHSKTGLSLRKDPNSSSKTILELTDKSEVKVIDPLDSEAFKNKKNDSWIKISYKGKEGFVLEESLGEYFLIEKKSNRSNSYYYEYWSHKKKEKCFQSTDEYDRNCFFRIFEKSTGKLIKFIDGDTLIYAEDWYDNNNLLVDEIFGDGGETSRSIYSYNIFTEKIQYFFDEFSYSCDDETNPSSAFKLAGKIILRIFDTKNKPQLYIQENKNHSYDTVTGNIFECKLPILKMKKINSGLLEDNFIKAKVKTDFIEICLKKSKTKFRIDLFY